MNIRLSRAKGKLFRCCLVLTGLVFLSLSGVFVLSASAQQTISKRYPAGKNVRLELKNISGTITVESWDRPEIKISATLESPTANFTPKQVGEGLVIDVMGDNRGRGDVGDVNFKVHVPYHSAVDL